MDFQNNSQLESGKMEQIVSQFLLKSLHIVLDSRIPSLHPHDRSGDLSSPTQVRKSDKWFNLILGDRPAALENLNFWHRSVMDPMIIDIILVRGGPSSSSVDNLYANSVEGTSVETIIERWVVQYETPRAVAPQTGDTLASYKKTYKKSIILLRTLYSYMRLLPAYRIFRQLSTSSQTYNFDIIYKVSSLRDPFSRAEEELMEEFSFAPVEAHPGRLSLSVNYRPTLADLNLEPSAPTPPRIITDYVGSPATDPLRSFPSSGKGFSATSFPSRGARPPSGVPHQRPHSWTSGFHRPPPFMHNRPFVGSPPAYRASPMSHDVGSPPIDTFANRGQNYRPLRHKRNMSADEYQLSPPFSPSPSPSPPTYLSSGNFNPMQTRIRSGTAPVSIPLPMGSPRYLSPNFSDPSRNSLPPLSPRSTRNDHSSQEFPSGIKAIRKLEVSRAGETHPGSSNHYIGQKVMKDSKDDSGRFSGLLSSSGSPRVGFSRSSSRLSFQDDLDDFEFSCPFDVDDVDTSDSQASDGKRPSEFISQSLPMGRKSQDAAVGVLVQMLRTAPPLRQDSSCYSSQSGKNEHEGGVATASGFFMPRKTSDALEELRSYRDMKDLLLSKSGTRSNRAVRASAKQAREPAEALGVLQQLRRRKNCVFGRYSRIRAMDYSSCPFCDLTVLSAELERHANGHFEEVEDDELDKQLARDLEFAQQLSLAPTAPPSAMTRTTFHKIEGGLMALLRGCLELEHGNTTTIVSGYIDHFQSIQSEDKGWGCGWRNIQMLSSHLLVQRQEAREVLFGGSGFVPDIPSLQRWLEIAWEKGFDTLGSNHFANNIYGSRKWIGATECAALFRSFGLRARLVDFGPKELEIFYPSLPGSSLGKEVKRIQDGGKRKAIQVRGPMDRYLLVRNHDTTQASSSGLENSGGSNIQLGDSMGSTSDEISGNKFTSKNNGRQVLIDWIWNYFSDNNFTKSGNHQRDFSSRPLYFQHDGHSRTIVGIQVKRQHNGMLQHNLLILDPGHRTEDLERSLREKVGWQKFVKRGVHTLKKPQYQLCYIDPGIASGEEKELLKTVESVFLEF
ncbi:hypothetical protein ACFX1S_042510 [Malus domestica]